jgi:DDE superfamily endonuclease
LFAALEVAAGKIIATHSKRRRRVEFLDFMTSVTAAFPGRKLHVILDNLNTHKKNEPWLKANPNVQFHFNRQARPGSIRSRYGSRSCGGSHLAAPPFASLKQLQEHIDAYVDAYKDKAEPTSGPRKRSVNAVSKAAVSPSYEVILFVAGGLIG